MKFLRLATVLCTALIATACLPVTSTVPVGSSVGFTPDPALTGMWKGHGEDPRQAGYLSFFPQDDGTITALMITPDGKDSSWATFSLQTATLGANRFMNAHEVLSNGKPDDDAEAQKTFPLLYRVNGDGALVIYLLDEKAAAVAIKSGAIAGTIGQGQFGDITLTAEPAALDAFMATPAGRALFVKPLILLKKMK